MECWDIWKGAIDQAYRGESYEICIVSEANWGAPTIEFLKNLYPDGAGRVVAQSHNTGLFGSRLGQESFTDIDEFHAQNSHGAMVKRFTDDSGERSKKTIIVLTLGRCMNWDFHFRLPFFRPKASVAALPTADPLLAHFGRNWALRNLSSVSISDLILATCFHLGEKMKLTGKDFIDRSYYGADFEIGPNKNMTQSDIPAWVCALETLTEGESWQELALASAKSPGYNWNTFSLPFLWRYSNASHSEDGGLALACIGGASLLRLINTYLVIDGVLDGDKLPEKYWNKAPTEAD